MAIKMQSEDYLNSLLIQFSEAFYLDDFQKLSFLSNLIKESPVLPSGIESPLLSHVEYQKFQEDMMYFDLVLSYMFSSQWDLISDHNDIQVESHISGADFYTRASVLINANIFESLAVISEVDLLTTW